MKKKYNLIFKITEEIWIPFYIDLTIKGGYGDSNFIFLYQRPRLEVYLSEKDSKKPADIGLKLFSNKKKAAKLIQKGRNISSEIDVFLKNKNLRTLNGKNDKDILRIFKEASALYVKYLSVYKYTELIYFKKVEKTIYDFVDNKVDNKEEINDTVLLMLNTSENRKIIQKKEEIFNSLKTSTSIRTLCNSVSYIGREKYSFRKDMNKIALFFQILMQIIAKRFNLSLRQLEFCLYDEILILFNGNKKDRKLVINNSSKRSNVFVTIRIKENWNFVVGKRAEKIMQKIKFEKLTRILNFKGVVASTGKAIGKARIMSVGIGKENIDLLKKQMKKMKKGEILVSKTTGPDMIIACRKAGAIVSEEGGICSHAAIISRELGIPCIINTKIATDVLKDGDLIEVDADNGVVKILKYNK